MEQAGFEGDRWDSFCTRLRVRYTPEAATQDIMLYTSGIRSTEQIRFIDYNVDMEDRYPVCGIGMVEDPGTCDFESSDGGSSGGGSSNSGETDGGTGSGEEGGSDDAGSDDNGWERESASTDLADWDTQGNKGGCSHTGQSGSGLGWSLLLGMMALFGRRRQSAG